MLGWSIAIDCAAWLFVMVGFSFLVWRQLRDDYPQDVLLSVLWKIGAGITLAIVVIRIFNGPILVGGLLTGLLIVGFLLRKSRSEIWEWVDVIAKYYWWWIILGAIYMKEKWYIALAGLGMIIGFLVSKNYKRVKMYPSGKSGIIAITLIWAVAIFEIVIDIFGPSHIYWGGLSVNQWLMVVVVGATTTLAILRAELKLK